MKRPPNPGDDSSANAAEQQAKVLELRRKRLTFADIGAQLGFSAQRAHQIYSAALKAIPAMQVEQHREEELTLIDDAIKDLWPLAHDHNRPRTAVEAWNSIRGWAERKARLLGLDVPTRVRVDAENLGREIGELLDALGGRPDDDGDDD